MNDAPEMGHNAKGAELDLAASDAARGLDIVAKGEADTVDGWLIYGAALNVGRALFPSDEQFGQWVTANLADTHDHDRAAAMWAAGDRVFFEWLQKNTGARTVRGWHSAAKEVWADAEAENAAIDAAVALATAQRIADEEAEARAKAEAAKSEEDKAEAEAEAEEKAKEKNEAIKVSNKKKKKADNAAKVANKKKPHVANNSGDNEWYTPPQFIEAALDVMGAIDLDPASSDVANERVQASKIYTKDDSGLNAEWAGRAWMNPPYSSDLIGKFCAKMAESYTDGGVIESITLVNNGTETAWFQGLAKAASAICFPSSRIKFLKPDGNPGAPLQGQAIIYCGRSPKKFAKEFSTFGLVVYLNGK